MARNIPGRAGPKSNQDKRNEVLVEDIREDYRKARNLVEVWEDRVKRRGATTKDRYGRVVRSAHQESLEKAQSHLLSVMRMYRDVVGAEPEEVEGDLGVVLTFEKKRQERTG